MRLLSDFLNGKEKGVFLYTALKDKDNKKSYLFINPVDEITCRSRSGIKACFQKVQKYTDRGYYAAGYFTFEAGYIMEKKLGKKTGMPREIFKMGIYKKPIVFRNLKIRQEKHGARDFWLYNIRPDTLPAEYRKKFRKIKEYIREGEIYQVNYCFKLKYRFAGLAGGLFKKLCEEQKVAYAGFINDGSKQVITLSPEKFFSIKGRNIEMKPMKGTVLKNAECGMRNAKLKLRSDKNKAENLMIVDLIRNDLGRICDVKSVRVPRLFSAEEYKTLFQMTSTVTGRLRKNTGFYGIFKAVFPSGSVTGAPKIRAMEIIKELEKEERGVYTGAIGYMSKKSSVFNIPIRTAVIDIEKGEGEMGIGSGVVNDSKPGAEYRECIGKAGFFTSLIRKYRIFESILLKDGKYTLLNRHLKRLKSGAEYFGITVNMGAVRKKLKKLSVKKGAYKVKLLVDSRGVIETRCSRVSLSPGKVLFAAQSRETTDSNNPFYRFKTTNRELYDREYRKYREKGFQEVIFTNEKGEVTEARSSNVFVKVKNTLFTPPVKCGLLPGTLRQDLLASGECREKVIHTAGLGKAEVFLGNSVRGLRRVRVKIENNKK